jgi:hypothetical protein
MRVGGQLVGARRRARLDPRTLRPRWFNHHVFEGLDLLSGSILQNLEIVPRQILNGNPVSRREDIYADEVGPRPERWLLVLRRLTGLAGT